MNTTNAEESNDQQNEMKAKVKNRKESTVEPGLAVTLLVQSVCYYSPLFLSWQNAPTFS